MDETTLECPECHARPKPSAVYRDGRRVAGEKQPCIYYRPSCPYWRDAKNGLARAAAAMPDVKHGGYLM